MILAILGYYGKANHGDNLMAHALSSVLNPNDDIEVVVYSDDTGPGVVNGLKNPTYLNADIIFIGGGGIVAPDFWAFRAGRLQSLIDCGKPVFFLNVNVYPEVFEHADFATQLRKLNAKWWVRDANSCVLLFEHNIEANYLPDITFREGVIAPHFPFREGNERILSVFLNHNAFLSYFAPESMGDWLLASNNAHIIARHLDWMADFGWKVQLIPAQTAAHLDDCVPGALIFGFCKNKDSITWKKQSYHWRSIIDIIRNSDMVLSQRYHSSTIAIASGVPLVDITHHIKNSGLLKDIKLQNLSVHCDNLTPKNLISATASAEKRGDYAHCVNLYRLQAHRLWGKFDTTWAEILNGLEALTS